MFTPLPPTHGDRPHLPTEGIILKGVAWTTGYRVFATFAQFGAMLVLVRIIPPEEYGRAGAVVGVLRFELPSLLQPSATAAQR